MRKFAAEKWKTENEKTGEENEKDISEDKKK